MHLIFYSHSDYSDVWPLLFKQTDKYFDNTFQKYLFTDKGSAPFKWTTLHYDDSLGYQERFASCLERVESDTVVYHHEDMFLYSEPDIDHMKILQSLTKKYDFVKLIKTGVNQGTQVAKGIYEFHKIPNDYFAIQPSIWKKESLLRVFKETPANNIWEFEVNAGHYCIANDILGLYCYDKINDRPRGGHYDSSIYPYIATAVVKGKWNFKEYKSELEKLFEVHNYEPSREVKW